MIFHENCLPAGHSHGNHALFVIFEKTCKILKCRLLQIIGGALRVKWWLLERKWGDMQCIKLQHDKEIKAPITTAAEGKFCNVFPNFQKKMRYDIS